MPRQYSGRVVASSVQWPRDIASVARSLATSGVWFWLDGTAAEPDGTTGVSYLGEAAEVLHAERGREDEYLSILRGKQETHSDGLGWVVAFGYEFGVGLMGGRPVADTASPAFALRPTVVLVLDHATQKAHLRGESAAEIDFWLERHGTSLHRVASQQAASVQSSALASHASSGIASQIEPGIAWRHSGKHYIANVQECKASIREGDAYVLCLTDTAEVTGLCVDPLDLYLELLRGGHAVRGAVIAVGDRALVSVSPERFLSARGNRVSTHPIKGTRARGETPEADERLANELAADPKERAENLMIVDLMRNDLSRVCKAGSVHTEGFLRVEHHPRVHQLVSTVSGELRADTDVLDAVAACFPGGSMTGAPKHRAVQLLAAIEKRHRGLYSGCFGWLGDDGDAELAMSIRCVELREEPGDRQTAFVGAGGGVTADSDPQKELAEKYLKAAPLLAALLTTQRTASRATLP